MPRGASRVRHSDVRKALRAFQEAGLSVSSVEIDPETGRITVRTDVAIASGADASEARASKALEKWLNDQPD